MTKPEAITASELVAASFEWGETTYAAGATATHKLTMDYEAMEQHPLLLWRLVRAMTEAVAPYRPDYIAGVPNGATGYAGAVALELSGRDDRDVFLVHLKKDTAGVRFKTDIDRDTAGRLSRAALIEDVFNTGKSTRESIDCLRSAGSEVVAVVAGFDRGNDTARPDLGVPLHSIAAAYIPPDLTPGTDVLRYIEASNR